ncbi:hypothetical protein PC118_g18824 [Phytophthora cactorum]|uniref:Uncharacterized protein n=1 Tax=Phytophthora cactorum TaxID=29920 RepID=A0A8T1F7F3_9STRA|nr:hypothetical protein PC118_g18824 [Phytophthora cactorum]
MPEHGAGRKGTPLPIYVGGASGRHAPRKKPFVKRGSRNRSGDEKETSPGKRKGVLLTERRTWNLLWALFIIAFVICLVCLVTLGRMVQDGSISNNEVSGGDSTKRGLFAVWKENQVLAKLKRLSHMFTSVDETKVKNLVTRHELSNLGDYECVGWRQTTNCTPAGEREYENDKNCTELIPNGVSGYCEVRNTRTGESNRVLAMHCDSLRPGVQFKCDMFQSLLSYSILSTDYEHDPNFSYTHNQDVFRARNKLSNTPIPHDPSGRVIFLHRNTEKLTYANNRILWTHIQQYKRTSALADYYVRGANGGKVFPQFKRCFGKDVHYEKLFTLKPMSAFPFENLEDDLLRFAAAGAEVLRLADYKEKDEEQTEETNKAEP